MTGGWRATIRRRGGARAEFLSDHSRAHSYAEAKTERGRSGMREPNTDKLNDLMGKLVGDVGAAMAGASILLGDRLGLYKAMADGEPVTSSELAKRTGLNERQIREWLSAQAASGYVDYEPERNAFSL